MTTTANGSVPLPSHLHPLPPRLTLKEVRTLIVFWNYAGSDGSARRYVADLCAARVLRSVTPFENGRRARFDSHEVIRAIYTVPAHNGS